MELQWRTLLLNPTALIPVRHKCTGSLTCGANDDNASGPSWDLINYALNSRQIGRGTKRPRQLVQSYLARRLPSLLRERPYDLNKINKIFAAQWMNDRQVAVGTKCNKLLVLDLLTNRIVRIPMLQSSPNRQPCDCPCGIHSLSVNPSRTLLATGGDNVNDVAIYRLPTFDPVCVGEFGHEDWVFDLKWLDDQIVVSGSRDSHMALWRIVDNDENESVTVTSSSVHQSYTQHWTGGVAISSDDDDDCDGLTWDSESEPAMKRLAMRHHGHTGRHGNRSHRPLHVPSYYHMKPISVKPCEKAEKVRAFAYNDSRQELAVLSLNAYLHLWDATTFTQKRTKSLRHIRENVCLATSIEDRLYAVGSQSHVTLVDDRLSRDVCIIASKQRGCGVRSLNFVDTLLTIGTGAGAIYFFDRRANKYLEMHCSHPCSLNVGPGWLRHDDTYQEFFAEQDYPNAVYVHCFDESGTKLFAAGGPLPAGLWGNYAGLWQ